KEGYKPILENHANALRRGAFPPPELLQRLGMSRLRAVVDQKMQRTDPTNYARRAVLVDLWTSADDVIDLDPVIHQAFDLPMLNVTGTGKPGAGGAVTVPERRDTSP